MYPSGRLRVRWSICGCLFGSSIFGYMQRTGIAIAAEPMMQELGLDQVALVRDVEPRAPAECIDLKYVGRCNLNPSCRLRAVLGAAQAQFLETLDVCAISDVLPARHLNTHRARMLPVRRQGRRGNQTTEVMCDDRAKL
jgi:hypothetical protein